jgi:hypothetical protein
MKKLRINGMKKLDIQPGAVIDHFESSTVYGTRVFLDVVINNDIKYFLLKTHMQYIGYTDDPFIAFEYLHNAYVYTVNELYEIARGRGNTLTTNVYDPPSHSTKVSYRETKAYSWLRKP